MEFLRKLFRHAPSESSRSPVLGQKSLKGIGLKRCQIINLSGVALAKPSGSVNFSSVCGRNLSNIPAAVHTYIFWCLLTFPVSASLASAKNFSTDVEAPDGRIPLVATMKNFDFINDKACRLRSNTRSGSSPNRKKPKNSRIFTPTQHSTTEYLTRTRKIYS
jgi:hypothetical protein